MAKNPDTTRGVESAKYAKAQGRSKNVNKPVKDVKEGGIEKVIPKKGQSFMKGGLPGSKGSKSARNAG